MRRGVPIKKRVSLAARWRIARQVAGEERPAGVATYSLTMILHILSIIASIVLLFL